jgi:hypothetical protein
MNNDEIESRLMGIAPKRGIPSSMIPQLIALMKDYPNLEVRGARQELTKKLSLLIDNASREGKL